MRFFAVLLTVLSCFVSMAAHAQIGEQRRLMQFNHAAPWDGVSADELDHVLVKQYANKPFQCRRAIDYTPEETPAAVRAFSAFVEYSKHGDSVTAFWRDGAARERRAQLLAEAIDAGSWKAQYTDAVWAFRMASNEAARQLAGKRLAKLAERGFPVAIYTYATYLDAAPDEQARLFSEAIDRGSPEAMVIIGGSMIVRSKQLRSMGEAMLDCALSQGYVNAYWGLGRLADMQGRQVDAYRLWEKGANAGCAGCIDELMAFPKIRPGEDLMPEPKWIKAVLGRNLFYDMTRLQDLATPVPADLAFHVSDGDVLRLLKLRAALQGAGG